MIDNNLYVVYLKDLPEELDKLNNTVLSKAGFTKVVCIHKDSYIQLIKDGTIPNFTLCIDRTYNDISSLISDAKGIEVSAFFSRTYKNEDSSFCLYGLSLSIAEIFQDHYKRYTWNNITDMFSFYQKFVLPEDLKVDVVESVPTVQEEVVQETTAEDTDNGGIDALSKPSVEPKDVTTPESLFKDTSSPVVEVGILSDPIETLSTQIELPFDEEDNSLDFYKEFYKRTTHILSLIDDLKTFSKKVEDV